MSESGKELLANIPPFGLRMQAELKDRIKAAAESNNRSMNSEIVARLEDSFQDQLLLPPHALEPIERRAKELRVPVRNLILDALSAAFPAGFELYEFVAKWGHLAAATSSRTKRQRVIEMANEDERARMSLLELREAVTSGGERHIQVYSGASGQWTLAVSLLVLKDED